MWLNLGKVVLEATDLQLICIQEASKNVFYLTPVTFPCVWEARFVSTKRFLVQLNWETLICIHDNVSAKKFPSLARP